ncbi:uncharacterized protein LOC132277982 [Cornus florida]|uniref:uncharacterized protein LOC132277982 n=1 Tax=Cornus florida TaxID=4283 RepID=UPI00289721B7|nr:uncharacterized protein LOC132277982 [Cornus florida]
MKVPQSCSWNCRKILQLRPLARKLLIHQVKNGYSTHFWTNYWLNDGPLTQRFSENQIQAMGYNYSTKVSQFTDSNTCIFPTQLTSAIPELIGLPPPSQSKDLILWKAGPSGICSLKHTIIALSPPPAPIPRFKLVWSSIVIPRQRMILWSSADKASNP